MNLKHGILAIGLLVMGSVNAQEEGIVAPPTEEVRAEIVDFPDVEAKFPGEVADLSKYISENFVYPELAFKNGDQGRVYVRFVVEEDGSITSVEVMRGGLTPELNEEAKRLVREMPRWEAAEKSGKKVRSRCRIPITFHYH